MNQSFYVGAVGAGSCTEKLSVIANNLANVNNHGFKPKTAVFSDLINYNLNDSPDAVTELQAGDSTRVERTYTTFDVAAMTQTDQECDYAISEPNMFFKVQDPLTGAVSYTRNGHFHRSEGADGIYLVTDGGKLVLDQNGEPFKPEVIDVEELRARMEGDYEPDEEVTDEGEEQRIGLYTFRNPSRLMSTGNGEYVPRDAGAEEIPVGTGKSALVQGALEASGTDVAREMTRLIECQRAFSYALRMVTTSDEIEGTINSLRG